VKCRIAPILFVFLLFRCGPLAAASGAPESQPYRIDSWQVDDGLPQSSVLSIVQTQDGYLWLGTGGGLVRFDGVKFQVFSPNNTPNLPSSRILSLFEDRRGTLWIGTEEGHLVRYGDGKFQINSPPGWAKLAGYIQSFAEDKDGSLWLISPEKDLIRFPQNQPGSAATNAEVLGANINFLAGDSHGHMWTSSDKEVGVWEGRQFTRIIERTPTAEFSPAVLAGSREGGCWVAADGRLRKFQPSGCVTDYGNYPWSKGNVVCMVEDHRGQVWVGTYGSGVYCYGTNGVARHFSLEDNLPGSFVRSIAEDHEGNIWVGLEGDRLARIKPVVFRSYGRKQGLSGDCVLSVCEGPEGELWLGTVADGVNRLKDGVIEHFGTAQGLANDFIHSVFYDRNDTLWVGTWGGGLCRRVGNGFESYTNLGDRNGIVCALYQDSKDNLWVGQQWSQPEIMRLQAGKPFVTRLQSKISGTDVRAVEEDRAGNIWIGTQGDGLYRIKDREQTHFGRREGLSNESIRSLHVDDDGTLWIGTLGGGLNRFKDGKFTSFTTKEGLVNDTLGFITEDSRGNLWCGSLAGVFRVSKEELNRFASGQSRWISCLLFTKSDGLPSVECVGGCRPSGCKTLDGRLWFPTVRGLAVVDPENIPVNRLPPPVAIDELVIEGRERKSIPDAASSTAPDRSTAPLKIAPGIQRLEFHYTGLSLTEPKKVRFKYKLEGLEEDWVEAGTRRTAYYSYLMPGSYQFRVQACNNDGVWNEQGASLALIILPHFWQTWWFKIVCAAAVVLVIVGIYEMRVASERKLARIRLRIASDLHDEVGSNLGSIALLSEMVPNSVQEIDEIRRVALATVGSLRDIVWFLDPASDNMHDLVFRMKDTARTLLPGIPFEFVAEGETGSTRPSLNLRRNVFPMFKEILHNVAKHARATRVRIFVKVASNQFHLCVEDDGVGFDEGKVRRGNGLKNLRRRAADLRGELQIQSQPGRGARFTITASIT
jgi:ligand-binding sensor domain-containing protein